MFVIIMYKLYCSYMLIYIAFFVVHPDDGHIEAHVRCRGLTVDILNLWCRQFLKDAKLLTE